MSIFPNVVLFSSTGISDAELKQGSIHAVFLNWKHWKLTGSLVLSVLCLIYTSCESWCASDLCEIANVLLHAGWSAGFHGFPFTYWGCWCAAHMNVVMSIKQNTESFLFFWFLISQTVSKAFWWARVSS